MQAISYTVYCKYHLSITCIVTQVDTGLVPIHTRMVLRTRDTFQYIVYNTCIITVLFFLIVSQQILRP